MVDNESEIAGPNFLGFLQNKVSALYTSTRKVPEGDPPFPGTSILLTLLPSSCSRADLLPFPDWWLAKASDGTKTVHPLVVGWIDERKVEKKKLRVINFFASVPFRIRYEIVTNS